MSPQNPQERTELRRETDRALVAVAAEARHGSRRQLLVVGVVIAFATVAGVMFGGWQRGQDIDAADYAQCRQENLPNAYLRLRRPPGQRDERPRANVVLPILWCRATVERDRPVRLRPSEERRYLKVVRRERLPVVDGDTGRVVGSEPLPTP